MDSGGRFGAVAGLERVKNPVLVARAVLDTPHLVLMGDGATRFARALGHADYDPTTPERRAATEKVKARLRDQAPDLPEFWRTSEWRKRWNYAAVARRRWAWTRRPPAATPSAWPCARPTAASGWRCPPGAPPSCCAAGSGDVPIYGAGLYAGAHGAAAATGTGERIIEVLLAHTVHGWLAGGHARGRGRPARGRPDQGQGAHRPDRHRPDQPGRRRLPAHGLGRPRGRRRLDRPDAGEATARIAREVH